MPLLMHHDHRAPVGHVTFAAPTGDGIPFEARIPKVQEEGLVKQRVDEAIHSLKYALMNAVSIGFQAEADKVKYLESGGMQFDEWEWLELSLVTIPANAEAMLSTIKNFDIGLASASGSAPESTPARVRATRTAPKGPFYFNPDKGT
jgi:HK97 family phage prohead protease